MVLEFKNSRGSIREIGRPQTEEDAMRMMTEFCVERNFRIYYVRETLMPGYKWYDVGSHSEFFYLWEDEEVWREKRGQKGTAPEGNTDRYKRSPGAEGQGRE